MTGCLLTLVAVDDKGGCLPVLDKVGRVPALIVLFDFGIPWHTTVLGVTEERTSVSKQCKRSRPSEFPGTLTYLVFREVKLLSGVISVLGVKDAIMVDQALETVSVSIEPARRMWVKSHGRVSIAC